MILDRSYFNKGVSQIITMIFSMLRVILFYKVYSLDLVGRLLFVTSVVNILAPLVTLSASGYFIRETVLGNRKSIETHIRAFVAYSYIVTIILAIAMFILMKSVIVVATVISMIVFFVVSNLMITTNVKERFEVYVFMSLVAHPVSVILTLILPSPFFVYTYMFISQIIVALYYDKDIIYYLLHPLFSKQMIGDFLNNIKHFSISSISSVILNNVDMLILGRMFTYTDISRYKLGVYIPSAIDSLTSTLSSVLFVRKGEDNYGKFLLMGLALSSVVFAILIPRQILSIVFNGIVDDFVVSVSRVFGVVSIIRIVNMYVTIRLIYNRRENIVSISNIVAMILDLILNVILGLTIGIIGIPIATLISEFCKVIFNTYKLITIEKVKSLS